MKRSLAENLLEDISLIGCVSRFVDRYISFKCSTNHYIGLGADGLSVGDRLLSFNSGRTISGSFNSRSNWASAKDELIIRSTGKPHTRICYNLLSNDDAFLTAVKGTMTAMTSGDVARNCILLQLQVGWNYRIVLI